MRGYEGTPIKRSTEAHNRALLVHERILKQLSAAFGTILQNAEGGGVAIAPIPSGSVTPHAATHRPSSGSDPLALAAAVTLHANSVNGGGAADAFSRADHTHALTTGAHTGGYAIAAAIGAGAELLRASAVLPFPEALGTLADRTKTITLIDDVSYGASLKPSATWTGGIPLGLSLFSPTGTIPFVIGPNGTMGRNQYVDTTLMIHSGVSISSATKLIGWDLVTLTATGTGGIQCIRASSTDKPSANSTIENIGASFTINAGNANANGTMTGMRVEISNPSGNSASRGALRCFRAKMPASALNQTYPGASWFECESGLTAGAGTITGANVGFLQVSAFALGTPRRGVQVVNSVESTANDILCSTAAKGLVNKDAQGTPEFWRTYVSATGLKDATLSIGATGLVTGTRGASATGIVTVNIQDIGTAASNT